MAILKDWQLDLDVDSVLRGQGADPAKIRGRSPHLVTMAGRALEEGLPLVQPRVLIERFTVSAIQHERVLLNGNRALQGQLLTQHLAPAEEVVVVLCSIGPELEEHTTQVMSNEVVYGLALYGVGSAAVEALANAACRAVEQEAAARELQTTIPLSPGMVGWSVAEGQPQLFELVDGKAAGIELTPAGIMLPVKSLSMVIGLGAKLDAKGRTCDYCAMRETCRYQDHYAPAN